MRHKPTDAGHITYTKKFYFKNLYSNTSWLIYKTAKTKYDLKSSKNKKSDPMQSESN